METKIKFCARVKENLRKERKADCHALCLSPPLYPFWTIFIITCTILSNAAFKLCNIYIGLSGGQGRPVSKSCNRLFGYIKAYAVGWPQVQRHFVDEEEIPCLQHSSIHTYHSIYFPCLMHLDGHRSRAYRVDNATQQHIGG